VGCVTRSETKTKNLHALIPRATLQRLRKVNFISLIQKRLNKFRTATYKQKSWSAFISFARVHQKLINFQKTSVETRVQLQILNACFPQRWPWVRSQKCVKNRARCQAKPFLTCKISDFTPCAHAQSSGVATHWILWINPGAARCWREAKCDNVLNEQRQSH